MLKRIYLSFRMLYILSLKYKLNENLKRIGQSCVVSRNYDYDRQYELLIMIQFAVIENDFFCLLCIVICLVFCNKCVKFFTKNIAFLLIFVEKWLNVSTMQK